MEQLDIARGLSVILGTVDNIISILIVNASRENFNQLRNICFAIT